MRNLSRLEADRIAGTSRLANWTGDLWVQLRNLASAFGVPSDQGRQVMSAFAHVHMYPHMCAHTPEKKNPHRRAL